MRQARLSAVSRSISRPLNALVTVGIKGKRAEGRRRARRLALAGVRQHDAVAVGVVEREVVAGVASGSHLELCERVGCGRRCAS